MTIPRKDNWGEAAAFPNRKWREALVAVVVPIVIFAIGNRLLGGLFPSESLKYWVNEGTLGKVAVYESVADRALPGNRLYVFGDSTAAGFSLPYEQSIQGCLEANLSERGSPLVAVNVCLAAATYRDAASVAGHFDFLSGDRVILQVNSAPKLADRFFSLIYLTAESDLLPKELAPPVALQFTRTVERTLNFHARETFPLLAQSESYEAAIRGRLKVLLGLDEGKRRRAMWHGQSQLSQARRSKTLREYEKPDRNERQETLRRYRILAKRYRQAFGQARLMVYLNPVNRTFLEDKSGVDGAKLHHWTKRVQQVFEEEGIPTVNLSNALPSEMFFDDNHPNSEGSRLLAKKLLEEMQ